MWFLFIPIWFAFNLTAYIIAPVLPLFAKDYSGNSDNGNIIKIEPRLPKYLSWFMTPDNSLWGDNGWQTIHCINYKSYFGMVKWLWRNPAYGFEKFGPLSAKVSSEHTIKYIGNKDIKDRPKHISGYCLIFIGNYWNFHLITPKLFGYCAKLEFGWKLQTYAEYPNLLKTEPYAQYVFSPRFSNIGN